MSQYENSSSNNVIGITETPNEPELNVEDCTESPNLCQYRYISEVDRLRMLRDVYREETEKINDTIRHQLEDEKSEKEKKAAKAELLLEYSKTVLKQLDQRHRNTESLLKESVALAKSINQQIRSGENEKISLAIRHGATSMKNILDELKQQQKPQ